jgi:hypothetical protein
MYTHGHMLRTHKVTPTRNMYTDTPHTNISNTSLYTKTTFEKTWLLLSLDTLMYCIL